MFKIENIISEKFELIPIQDREIEPIQHKYKVVSKDEFDNFIRSYQNELVFDLYAVCEPALITYNDFTLGKYPDSIVAYTWIYGDNPEDRYYCDPEDRHYYILK